MDFLHCPSAVEASISCRYRIKEHILRSASSTMRMLQDDLDKCVPAMCTTVPT
jgi:hypothetical protein